MPLTADQQAMLQLLLERGQTYADLAGVLGIGEDEVRERARVALTELGGADPDRNVGLTDWLLGQADPIGRADAVRHLREDADDHRLAASLLSRLADVAPQATLPRLPGEPRGGFLRRPPAGPAEPATAPTPTAPEPAPKRAQLSQLAPEQRRLIAILGTGAGILLIVVLAIAGVFGGGSDDSAATTGASTTDTTSTAGDESIARVPLQPVDNGDAAGLATVGIAGKTVPYLDLQLRNLEPAPNGQSYIVWFLFTPGQGYPLAPLQNVTANGSYDDRFQIPSAAISLISRARYIEVALAPNETVANAITKASKDQTLVIDVPGTPIARGAVPKAAGSSTP